MKKGFYQTITISLFAHLLLISLLVQQSATPPAHIKPKLETKAIKSFLYTPIAVKEITSVQVEPSELVEVPSEIPAEIKTEKTLTKAINKPEANLKAQPKTSQITSNSTAAKPSIEQPTQATVKQPQIGSARQQLDKLRAQMNRRASSYNSQLNNQTTSPSVFNRNVVTVPHSSKTIDPEEKRRRNTQKMGSGISITKNDNGTCSISQDMSIYGLEHGSSTQHFDCGESKFDRSFREHMQQVQKKLGKKK